MKKLPKDAIDLRARLDMDGVLDVGWTSVGFHGLTVLGYASGPNSVAANRKRVLGSRARRAFPGVEIRYQEIHGECL